MKKIRIEINNIPAIVWGEKSEKLFIAVHGNMSHKEDTVISMLAEEATKKGYQVLSFDLPEHGDRKEEETLCKVQVCVKELHSIIEYARKQWNELSMFACSMGAYFSLLAFQNITLKKALLLSPVVDMERIIVNMMMWFQVSPERLQEEETIVTPIGQNLYWDYFCYVKEHPIQVWVSDTSILYGAKDELCEFDTIESFVNRFPCDLEVVEDGEHFFHTEGQLEIFKEWLCKCLKEE